MKEQSLRVHTFVNPALPMAQYDEGIQLDHPAPFAHKAMDENLSDEMVDKRDFSGN